MKKLFFFRSSSNDNSNVVSPSTNKEACYENPLEGSSYNHVRNKTEDRFRSPKGMFSKTRKQAADNQGSTNSSGLRRSRSLSSAAFLVDGLEQTSVSSFGDKSISPHSTVSNARHKQCGHSSLPRTFTPERWAREKQQEVAPSRATQKFERTFMADSSKGHNHSSGNASSCSSNVSSKVLDRYIDGEEQEERTKKKSQRNCSGNSSGKLPPRVQYTAPASPSDSIKDKPKSHSFRAAKGTHFNFSSKDWVENGFGHDSPRRLAKNVIERLSQTHAFPTPSSKSVYPDIPITFEDVYCDSLDKCLNLNSDAAVQKSSHDGHHETANGYHGYGLSGYDNFVGTGDDIDVELENRYKEAEKKVMLLSEDLEQERFLCDCGFDVPSLVQAVRKLTEEKIGSALEIASLLQFRIAERASAKEGIKMAKRELELQTRRLEKEKIELQAGLEKELDRRSSDWSSKLEKYKLEEQRLRERVRELAEQNVSLQREVSSFHEREAESRNMMTYSERKLKDLTATCEEANEENRDLRQNLSELEEKYRGTVEDLDCIRRNFEEKDKECKDLQKSITRLLRTCSEQEKTIEGLREGFNEEIGKKQSLQKSDQMVKKLQMEQMRLTGIELALRKEVESCRIETDSLRQENISLLNRLKSNGNEIGVLTFKLDKEMENRISFLQNQGLSMLNDSTKLCAKLLEFMKEKAGQLSESQHGDMIKNGLGGQFIIESDMKVHGFKRGAESLARSLQTVSNLMHEKFDSAALASESPILDADGSKKVTDQISEEKIRAAFKAETLLTSLLREKMYSKELEVEQLQAELATAVRGNDILKCEVQNAVDNLSCATHKLKDLEIQVLKKDENINRLQSSLEAYTKELTIANGMLPKVLEERNLLWNEVKQYNEKNMILNSEVNALRKKIETLDEDVLLKEGQITILRDTLGSNHLDLLDDSDSAGNFLLE